MTSPSQHPSDTHWLSVLANLWPGSFAATDIKSTGAQPTALTRHDGEVKVPAEANWGGEEHGVVDAVHQTTNSMGEDAYGGEQPQLLQAVNADCCMGCCDDQKGLGGGFHSCTEYIICQGITTRLSKVNASRLLRCRDL